MLKTDGFLAAAPVVPDEPAWIQIRTLSPQKDCDHESGRPGGRGWAMDYSKDEPGYAISRPKDALLLEPGFYRATFLIRRGHYPASGFLQKQYGLFRIEIWDVTDDERIAFRDLQIGDFSQPNEYQPRWVEFSMAGREGHVIEPRAHWPGMANGEVASIQIDRFPDVSLVELDRKAHRFGDLIEREHLENGFVVSRNPDGAPDETGDALTYTGFYTASLAWKYSVTKDEFTYQALENALQTLHNAIKGTAEQPIIVRFVDKDGTPFPKSPSKDVYTSFFLAYSAAYPQVRNEALRAQMRLDVDRIAGRFIKDGLTVKAGPKAFLSLTPYLTDEEVSEGIDKMLKNKRLLRKISSTARQVKRYTPMNELWPGMKNTVRAIERRNPKQIKGLVVPAMNGAFDMALRGRDLLRERYRSDFIIRHVRNNDHPGKLLADAITETMKKIPQGHDGRRIHQVSDLKVLASNALISLNIIKTAAVITKDPKFETYYRRNLYGNQGLLKTAVQWYGFEDEFLKLTAGNGFADQERRGYLGALSLMNLLKLEEEPETKNTYKAILKREQYLYRNEDNPMTASFDREGKGATVGLIMRDLLLYPDDRQGFGNAFWKEHGKEVADKFGGGEEDDHSREPLPISRRPKDSFLWQRNARRLSGDDENRKYPPTDYLFVYWFSRAKGLIPATPAAPTASHH